MSKKRFIELHGEEAWEIEKEKRNLSRRRWCKDNPDKAYAITKKWRDNNRDKANEFARNEYRANKEYKLLYAKKYSEENKEKRRAQYLSTNYKREDKSNNRGDSTITSRWILDNIFASSCVYCGESDWTKLGCDRIDNTKAHTPDNVVCACWSCNSQRKSMSVEEFKLKKQQELNSCAKILPPAAS